MANNDFLNNDEFLEEIRKYQKKKVELINKIDPELKLTEKKLKKFDPKKIWGKDTEKNIEKLTVYNHYKNKLVSNKLGSMLITLIENYSHSKKFNRYTELEDFKSDAIIACFKALDKFDINRNKPFSYFTTTTYRSFLASIKEKYENDNFKLDLYEEYYHDQGKVFVNEVKKDILKSKKKKDNLSNIKKSKKENK
jgi:hypothetical protein